MKFKEYKEKVNEEILQLMEEHGTDWTRPYNEKIAKFGYPHNAIRGNVYRGMNAFHLSWAYDYKRPMFATYKQWTDIGADMSETRGTGVPVFYFNMIPKKGQDANGKEYTYTTGFYRVYRVFNIEHVKNVDESKLAANKVELNDIEPDEQCDTIIKATEANITHETTVVPCYVPSLDEIRMPKKESFNSTEDYYATLFHELTHWTGHKSRLDRFGKERTTQSYAFEELIAEIGSAQLCASSRIAKKPRADHAKYLNNWIQAIKDDDNVMVKAFSKANKATEFILGE